MRLKFTVLRILLILAFFPICFNVQSQQTYTSTVTISGYIKDYYTNEPAFSVNVYIESLQLGTTTDLEGYYSLEIPKGTFNIGYSRVDLIAETRFVDILENKRIDVFMKEKTYNLDAVTIYSENQDVKIKSLDVGKNTLDIEKINSLPSFMGESDVVKSLILLPGVSTVGEGSSGFNVRGGGVDQNLILQDGAVIFNPSHVFGFFSAFNPAMVDNATLYKSGIPAKYGGRLSSVLNIDLKEGDFNGYHANAGVGIIASKFSIDGPIVKEKVSFNVGSRASYSDWMFNAAKAGDFMNSSAAFLDANLKLSWMVNDNNQLNYSGYYSHDGFSFASDTAFNWSTLNHSISWNHIFSEKTVMVTNLVSGKYNYNIQDKVGLNSFAITSEIGYQTLRSDLSYEITKGHSLFAGVEGALYHFQPGLQKPLDSRSGVERLNLEKERSFEGAVYLEDEFRVNSKLSFRGGLRYSTFTNFGPGLDYTFGSEDSKNFENVLDTVTYEKRDVIASYGGLEPRLTATYLINPKSSIKISYNRIRQYLHLISNTAAVTPTDFWKTSNFHIPPEIGDQISVGYFHNFKNNSIETSVEAYYKHAQNIVDFKDGSKLLMHEYIESVLINGSSDAYGIEFFANKKRGSLTGWVGYTFSRIFRTVNGKFEDEVINLGNPYPANYDKPHDFTFAVNYEESPVIQYGANFSYSTGRPATVPLGAYDISNLTNVFNYSLRNQERIPDYHRLDLSMTIKSKPRIDRNWQLSWTIAVYNVYGHKNAYSVFFENQDGSPPKAYKLSVLGSPFPSLTVNLKM